jgi:serine protease inhibitor
MLQAKVSKTVNITAGGLSSALAAEEKSSITNLTLTGTIDGRDFVTMRDSLSMLSELNLCDVIIVAYRETDGTDPNNNYKNYQADEIPGFAFNSGDLWSGKTSLTSVILPSSVTSIGESAFLGCYSLESINIPSSVTTIGDYTFSGCSCMIMVDESNPKYSSADGVLYNKSQTKLIQCPSLKKGSFSIPSTVIYIAGGAFYGCYDLKSVSIPSSVTSIENNAFEECYNLTSIYLHSRSPIDLCFFYCNFLNENLKCTLFVPVGLKQNYLNANGLEDFGNIKEMTGFSLSSTIVNITNSKENITKVSINSNVRWTASSDQKWLTVSPASGNGNDTLIFIAGASSTDSIRMAKVTVSAWRITPQIITVLQVPKQQKGVKTVYINAGGLYSALTDEEKKTVINLTVMGTIDARDFKTIRDNMPLLSELDLSRAKVSSYSGSGGTYPNYNDTTYQADAIPGYAFGIGFYWERKISLTSVILPSSITLIGERSFEGCSGLNSVCIPSSVTSIGNTAFGGCIGLTSVKITPTVTYIGEGAFGGCSSLTTVTIPSSVTSIGDFAFWNSRGFIKVDARNPNYSSIGGVLYNKTQTTLMQCPISKMGYFSIPLSVYSIGESAFEGCSGLTSVTIPPSVTTIGDYTFSGCSGLTSIYAYPNFPIDSIDSRGVFEDIDKNNCILYVPFGSENNYRKSPEWKDFKNIVEVESDSYQPVKTVILENAGVLDSLLSEHEKNHIIDLTIKGFLDFRDFQTLRYLPLLSVLDLSGVSVKAFGWNDEKTLPNYAFYCWFRLSSVALPSSINTIGVGAFSYCSSLTSVSIPSSVTSIGNQAFSNCSSLSSVSIPSSVDSIGNEAFMGCSSLMSVTIPSSVITIGDGAFDRCCGFIVDANNPNYSSIDGVLYNKTQTTLIHCPTSKKGNFIIPSSVTLIKDYTFYNCSGLESVIIPPSVTTIEDYAFSGCSGLTSITIPSSVTYIGFGAFDRCCGFKVDANNPNYSSIDGVLYNKTQTTLINCPTSKKENFIIPSSVTLIKDYAFYNCSGLESVIIPPSVTTIGNEAFSGCSSLTSVTIPFSVTSIGEKAFDKCSGLTSLTIPSSVTSVGENVFDEYSCLGKLVDVNNDFAFKIYKATMPDYYNFFISPFSLHIALSVANEGAGTTTRKEIDQLLCIHDMEDRGGIYSKLITRTTNLKDSAFNDCIQRIWIYNKSSENILYLANSLWINENFKIDESYKKTVEEKYYSEVFDFGKLNIEEANQKLNNWISEKTHGKIKEISGFDEETRLSIINAIYFLGEWSCPFDENNTKEDIFYTINFKDEFVKFMNAQSHYRYYEDNDIQSIFLPYKCNQLSMIVILPREKFGISEIEDKINSEYLSKIYELTGGCVIITKI